MYLIFESSLLNTRDKNKGSNKTSLKVNPIIMGRSLSINNFKRVSERFKEKEGTIKKPYGYWIKIIK